MLLHLLALFSGAEKETAAFVTPAATLPLLSGVTGWIIEAGERFSAKRWVLNKPPYFAHRFSHDAMMGL